MVLLKYSIAVILTMAVSYLLGSLSFSIITTRKFHNNADIRTMGSGNAGLTNVVRSASKKAAALTLVGDFLKGVLAALFGKFMFMFLVDSSSNTFIVLQLGAFLAGICCLIGHVFPCFFKFRGGKGVLTASAIILVIDFRVFIAVIAMFVIVLLCSKIVSLGSICAAAFFPISNFLIVFFFDYLNCDASNKANILNYIIISTILATFIAAFVIYKHKSNIKRLRAGKEKRISFHK